MKRILKGIFDVIPDGVFGIIIVFALIYFMGKVGDYFGERAYNANPKVIPVELIDFVVNKKEIRGRIRNTDLVYRAALTDGDDHYEGRGTEMISYFIFIDPSLPCNDVLFRNVKGFIFDIISDKDTFQNLIPIEDFYTELNESCRTPSAKKTYIGHLQSKDFPHLWGQKVTVTDMKLYVSYTTDK